MERGFRDRDFIRTPEGFLFCVVGSTHPPDRVMAYLKYVPSSTGGPWRRKGLRYARTMSDYTMASLRATLAILKSYPFYISFFRAFGTEMSSVPLDRIEEHYRPEERLEELASSSELDILEEKALSLASLISDMSGVSLGQMGITGSILLGIHVPGVSDIDLVVYGLEASAEVKKALGEALDDRGVGVDRLRGEMARAWCTRKTRLYPLEMRDAERILAKKWNIGIYRGTRFSIHPVRTEREAERYGERIFKPMGRATVLAKVRDAREAMFLPAIYKVEGARVLEGPSVRTIEEICSYEDIYADVAGEGEEVLARGKLEMVFDRRRSATYFRLLIGSLSGGDEFIKPLGEVRP